MDTFNVALQLTVRAANFVKEMANLGKKGRDALSQDATVKVKLATEGTQQAATALGKVSIEAVELAEAVTTAEVSIKKLGPAGSEVESRVKNAMRGVDAVLKNTGGSATRARQALESILLAQKKQNTEPTANPRGVVNRSKEEQLAVLATNEAYKHLQESLTEIAALHQINPGTTQELQEEANKIKDIAKQLGVAFNPDVTDNFVIHAVEALRRIGAARREAFAEIGTKFESTRTTTGFGEKQVKLSQQELLLVRDAVRESQRRLQLESKITEVKRQGVTASGQAASTQASTSPAASAAAGQQLTSAANQLALLSSSFRSSVGTGSGANAFSLGITHQRPIEQLAKDLQALDKTMRRLEIIEQERLSIGDPKSTTKEAQGLDRKLGDLTRNFNAQQDIFAQEALRGQTVRSPRLVANASNTGFDLERDQSGKVITQLTSSSRARAEMTRFFSSSLQQAFTEAKNTTSADSEKLSGTNPAESARLAAFNMEQFVKGLEKGGPDSERVANAMKTINTTSKQFVANNKEAFQAFQDSNAALNDTIRKARILTGIEQLRSARAKQLAGYYRAIRGLSYTIGGFAIGLTAGQKFREAFSGAAGLQQEVAGIEGILPRRSPADADFLRSGIANTATQYGADVIEAARAAKIFAQTGLDAQQVMEELDVTMLGMRGLGITIEQMQELQIAVRAVAGETEALGATSAVLDKIARVESQFAITATNIADAIKLASPVVKQFSGDLVGLADSIDLTIGLSTVMVEQLRISGNQAGNSLKFILARLARPEVLNKLQSSFGVRLGTEGGKEFLGINDIIKELVGTFQDLDQAQRQQFAVLLSGGRRVNSAIAFLTQYDRVLEVARESATGFGDAQDRTNIQLNTLKSSMEQLNAAFVVFASNISEGGGLSRGLQGIANGIRAILTLSSQGGEGGLLSILGLLGTGAVGVGAIKGTFGALNNRQLAGKLVRSSGGAVSGAEVGAVLALNKIENQIAGTGLQVQAGGKAARAAAAARAVPKGFVLGSAVPGAAGALAGAGAGTAARGGIVAAIGGVLASPTLQILAAIIGLTFIIGKAIKVIEERNNDPFLVEPKNLRELGFFESKQFQDFAKLSGQAGFESPTQALKEILAVANQSPDEGLQRLVDAVELNRDQDVRGLLEATGRISVGQEEGRRLDLPQGQFLERGNLPAVSIEQLPEIKLVVESQLAKVLERFGAKSFGELDARLFEDDPEGGPRRRRSASQLRAEFPELRELSLQALLDDLGEGKLAFSEMGTAAEKVAAQTKLIALAALAANAPMERLLVNIRESANSLNVASQEALNNAPLFDASGSFRIFQRNDIAFDDAIGDTEFIQTSDRGFETVDKGIDFKKITDAFASQFGTLGAKLFEGPEGKELLGTLEEVFRGFAEPQGELEALITSTTTLGEAFDVLAEQTTLGGKGLPDEFGTLSVVDRRLVDIAKESILGQNPDLASFLNRSLESDATTVEGAQSDAQVRTSNAIEAAFAELDAAIRLANPDGQGLQDFLDVLDTAAILGHEIAILDATKALGGFKDKLVEFFIDAARSIQKLDSQEGIARRFREDFDRPAADFELGKNLLAGFDGLEFDLKAEIAKDASRLATLKPSVELSDLLARTQAAVLSTEGGDEVIANTLGQESERLDAKITAFRAQIKAFFADGFDLASFFPKDSPESLEFLKVFTDLQAKFNAGSFDEFDAKTFRAFLDEYALRSRQILLERAQENIILDNNLAIIKASANAQSVGLALLNTESEQLLAKFRITREIFVAEQKIIELKSRNANEGQLTAETELELQKNLLTLLTEQSAEARLLAEQMQLAFGQQVNTNITNALSGLKGVLADPGVFADLTNNVEGSFRGLFDNLLSPIAKTYSERIAENLTKSLAQALQGNDLLRDAFGGPEIHMKDAIVDASVIASDRFYAAITTAAEVAAIRLEGAVAPSAQGGDSPIVLPEAVEISSGLKLDAASTDRILGNDRITLPKGVDISGFARRPAKEVIDISDKEKETNASDVPTPAGERGNVNDLLLAAAGTIGGSLIGGAVARSQDRGTEFVSTGASLGSLLGNATGNPVIGAAGGVIGGLLGGFLGSKDEDEKDPSFKALSAIHRAQVETIATIERQTDALINPQNRLINLPTGFTVPDFNPGQSGAITENFSIQVTVNGDGATPAAAANIEQAVVQGIAQSRRTTSRATRRF